MALRSLRSVGNSRRASLHDQRHCAYLQPAPDAKGGGGMNEVAMKQCSHPDCLQWYPATTEFFNRHRGGLATRCKVCNRKKDKAYQSRPEIHERRRFAQREAYRHSPEVRARNRVSKRNQRARKRAVSGTHTEQQIQEQLKRQHCRCYYCKSQFERRYIFHVEHTFPLSRVAGSDIKANDIDYLVLACPTCNNRKKDKYPWEFFEGGRLL